MFCTKCGHEIDASSRFCSFCGQEKGNAGPVTKANNVAASSNFGFHDGKRLVCEGRCTWVYSPVNSFLGNAKLTEDTFYYKRTMVSVVGSLGNVPKEFSFNLSDIANIRDGKMGISDTLVITLYSGREFNFSFSNKGLWIKSLKSVWPIK